MSSVFQKNCLLLGLGLVFILPAAQASLITDPDDSRNWQGATVGTFANLFYGADTAANRQAAIDAGLLDDGLFNTTGFNAAPLINCGGCRSGVGKSFDATGTGSFAYGFVGETLEAGAGAADDLWIQTGNVVGANGAVWDLGVGASTAVVFNTIDHGPLPQEAIEATVYLSNTLSIDPLDWELAETQRVWLEGYVSELGVKWDGFTYAVGT